MSLPQRVSGNFYVFVTKFIETVKKVLYRLDLSRISHIKYRRNA